MESSTQIPFVASAYDTAATARGGRLERDFGYEFDETSFDNEAFAGFVKSREYAERREDRD